MVDLNIYNFTYQQQQALDNPSNDIEALYVKFSLLTSVSSDWAIVGAITTIYTIAFIIALALLINEFIPFT